MISADGGEAEDLQDEWPLFTKKEERRRWWRGIAEFEVDSHYLTSVQATSTSGKQKRGEGEVFPREMPETEWPL